MPALNIKHTDIRELPYDALQAAFYGTHYITISPKMAEWLNPNEILSKYAGAGKLKRENAHLPRDARGYPMRSATAPSFREVIRQLDDAGFALMKGAARDWDKLFNDKPGDQQERLSHLDESVQNEFVESFLQGAWRIYDPNIDGKDKRIYARHIYRHLERLEEQLGPIRM